MDAAAKVGRNPVSSTRFSLRFKNEQADAERDGRTRVAKPNSQARTGTTSRIGNLTRLVHTLLYVMTIDTHKHTCNVTQRILVYSLYDYPKNSVARITIASTLQGLFYGSTGA